METRFAVDSNAGKLARWLRMMGYDALFFRNIEDGALIDIALEEGRVVLTRDSQLMKRRVVTGGQVTAILLQNADPREQLRQVVQRLNLDSRLNRFTRCLECNQNLVPRTKEEVRGLVPPHVFRTQEQYMQCPSCLRVYWQGTHWERMKRELEKLASPPQQ